MPKDFVFNMGYDTSHIMSVLGEEGIEEGSKVFLVLPQKIDSRQSNSIEDIENYLNSLDFDVFLEEIRLSHDFQENLKVLNNLFDRLENCVLSLSGGPRDHLISLIVAAMYSEDQPSKIVFRSDLDSEIREIGLPGIFHDLNDSEQKVLDSLTSNYQPVEVVREDLDISDSTVRRCLTSLVDQGLIDSSKIDGKMKWRVKVSGRIVRES